MIWQCSQSVMIYIMAWLRIGNVLEASRYSIVFLIVFNMFSSRDASVAVSLSFYGVQPFFPIVFNMFSSRDASIAVLLSFYGVQPFFPIIFNMFSSRDASVVVSLSFYGVQPFFPIVFNMFSSHDASVAVSLSFYGVQPFFPIIFNMFSSRVTSVVTSKLRKRSEKRVTQKIWQPNNDACYKALKNRCSTTKQLETSYLRRLILYAEQIQKKHPLLDTLSIFVLFYNIRLSRRVS